MQVRKRFEASGGTLFEFTAAEVAHVHPNGVALQLPPMKSDSSGGGGSGSQPQEPITGRMLVDCMVRGCREHLFEGVCTSSETQSINHTCNTSVRRNHAAQLHRMRTVR